MPCRRSRNVLLRRDEASAQAHEVVTNRAAVRGSIGCMRIGIAALVLASCAPKPPEPLEPAHRQPSESVTGELPHAPEVRIVAARPDIDVSAVVPDLHDELRWPLTAMSHPSLEPRFGVAAVFAEAGVGWLELCKRGVHKRTSNGRNRDELEYLRGWCGAMAGDAEAACGSLQRLTHSTVLGLSSAVKIDLANIIANAGHIEKAEHLITKYRIDDPEVLDTLAATYVEVGAERDAYEINLRAIDNDARASEELQCRRLIKQIALSPEGERTLPVEQLTSLVKNRKLPDPTCVRLLHAWTCHADPKEGCAEYLAENGISADWMHVLRAYYAWPKVAAAERTYLLIAQEAQYAWVMPEAQQVMFAALEAAARGVDGCGGDTYRKVKEIASYYLRLMRPVPERLQALEKCGAAAR